MRVSVTQEDIDKGVLGHSLKCPLARAIGRARGHPVTVDTSIWGPVTGGYFMLPASAVRFRVRYDAGLPVEPMEFEL